MIKLDKSDTLVVVYCTECGHWRAAAWTLAEGHDRAVAHEQLVHPDQRQAEKARHKFLSRHAADSGNVDTRLDDLSHEHSRPAGVQP